MSKTIFNKDNHKPLGKESSHDIVLSCKMKIVRNLAGFPFPYYATNKQLQEIDNQVNGAICNSTVFKQLDYVNISRIGHLDKKLLIEKNLITQNFIYSRGHSLYLSKPQDTSLMINEDDHIRMLIIRNGLKLERIFELGMKHGKELQQQFRFEHSNELGFLTSSLSNVGTGIKLTAVMHLPALVLTKEVKTILKFLTEKGIEIRGIQGIKGKTIGAVFQLYNKQTLGVTEEEIFEKIDNACHLLIRLEREAGDKLYQMQKEQMEDSIGRAYGILTNCKKISLREALNLLSYIRLGRRWNLLPTIPYSELDDLMHQVQKGHLQTHFNQDGHGELNYPLLRANLLTERLRKWS